MIKNIVIVILIAVIGALSFFYVIPSYRESLFQKKAVGLVKLYHSAETVQQKNQIKKEITELRSPVLGISNSKAQDGGPGLADACWGYDTAFWYNYNRGDYDAAFDFLAAQIDAGCPGWGFDYGG